MRMGAVKKGAPKKLRTKGRVGGGERLRVLLGLVGLGVGEVVLSGRGRENVQRKPAEGGGSPCPCTSPCPWSASP